MENNSRSKCCIMTERLVIRPVVEEDWRCLQQIWIDFDQSPYYMYDQSKSTEDESVRNRIAKWAAANRNGREHMFLAVCRKGEACDASDDAEAGEMLGFISLNIRYHGYEVGYGFLNRSQGHGYGTESLIAVCNWLRDMGVSAVEAGTALNNLPSVAILRKAGFELVGTEELAFVKDDKGRDIWFTGGNFRLGLK